MSLVALEYVRDEKVMRVFCGPLVWELGREKLKAVIFGDPVENGPTKMQVQ